MQRLAQILQNSGCIKKRGKRQNGGRVVQFRNEVVEMIKTGAEEPFLHIAATEKTEPKICDA